MPTRSRTARSSTPLRIASSQVALSDARAWTDSVFITKSDLTKLVALLDSTKISNVASKLGLNSKIASDNQDVVTGAQLIWKNFFEKNDPNSNEVFDLSIEVSSTNLTVIFNRDNTEPVPTGCTFSSDGGPSGTGIEAECSPDQPAGINTLLIQDLVNGGWTDDPADTSIQPGSGSLGPEWAFLNSSSTWLPNQGPDSGYAPTLVDYPATKHSTVQSRVCSSNPWGLNCTAPVTVTDYRGGLQGGGGGGGAGGGGAGGSGGGGSGPQPISDGCGHLGKPDCPIL